MYQTASPGLVVTMNLGTLRRRGVDVAMLAIAALAAWMVWSGMHTTPAHIIQPPAPTNVVTTSDPNPAVAV